MKLLLDTANVAEIKEAAGYYPVCGVTTNPSIISREESDAVSYTHLFNSALRKSTYPQSMLKLLFSEIFNY